MLNCNRSKIFFSVKNICGKIAELIFGKIPFASDCKINRRLTDHSLMNSVIAAGKNGMSEFPERNLYILNFLIDAETVCKIPVRRHVVPCDSYIVLLVQIPRGQNEKCIAVKMEILFIDNSHVVIFRFNFAVTYFLHLVINAHICVWRVMHRFYLRGCLYLR